MKPEDILPDEKDIGQFGSETVRKGTVGAFLTNSKIIENSVEGSPEYRQAVADLTLLLPKLKALGVFDVFEIRPGKVRDIIDKII